MVPLQSWDQKKLAGTLRCHPWWPKTTIQQWQATARPLATTAANGAVPRRAMLLLAFSAPPKAPLSACVVDGRPEYEFGHRSYVEREREMKRDRELRERKREIGRKRERELGDEMSVVAIGGSATDRKRWPQLCRAHGKEKWEGGRREKREEKRRI